MVASAERKDVSIQEVGINQLVPEDWTSHYLVAKKDSNLQST